MYLTKTQILEAQDLLFEDVDVPEWGGTVRMRALTGAERDQYELEGLKFRGQQYEVKITNFRARLVAMCAVDEGGQRLFSDHEVTALSKKSAQVLDRLFDVARRLSGMTPEDVEDLEKNLSAGQSGGSGSA